MKMLKITEQLNGDYFTFYDNDQGSILRDAEGLEYASVRPSIDDVAGDYGSVYITSKQGKRRVAVKGDLVSNDVFTLRRTLLRALRQTGVMKLIQFTTYDDLLLQFEAEVVNVINPYTHQVHEFMIELSAPDWRLYSQTLKSQNIAQTFVQGGGNIPMTIPFSLVQPSPGEVDLMNIIQNDGNEATDPIITITGPGTNFTIGNITTGKDFTLTYALIADDVVVIDVKNRTVVLNGLTNIYSSITGDFWSIIPGDNELRFFVESGLTVDTKLNVSYRDAFNGV